MARLVKPILVLFLKLIVILVSKAPDPIGTFEASNCSAGLRRDCRALLLCVSGFFGAAL